MRIYNIKDSYIQFLRQYEMKVAENKHEKRPYVGVVIKIGDVKYYTPFTSPKKKHQYMKNREDFRKIAGGTLGAINLNNMIPVPDNALIIKDFTKEPDVKYRRLLIEQYKSIKADWDSIQKAARTLRNLVVSSDENLTAYQKRIKQGCCDLVLLESVYSKYSTER